MNPEFNGPNDGRPEFLSFASLEVPPERPIVVNDVMKRQFRAGITAMDLDIATRVMFASSFKAQPEYFSLEQLSEPTLKILELATSKLDERTTAVIFPGNGAQPLYEDIWKNNFSFGYKYGNVFTDKDVWVQRIFENGKPKSVDVQLSKGMRDAFDWPRYKTVLVVDDVIATGMTLNAIRKKIEYAPYRKYDFVAVSWFCRNPNMVEGYKIIFSAIQYKSTEGYPSLNSISTWLRTDEKGYVVRENYKKGKFIAYKPGFDKDVKNIRSLTTIGESP